MTASAADGFDVLNLQFPSWCDGLCVRGYHFTRVEDYRERLAGLQHVASCQAEFRVAPSTGAHQVTARVLVPEREEKPVFLAGEESCSELDDILLLLSLATGRDVFTLWGRAEDNSPRERLHQYSGEGAILGDPRISRFGQVLRVSIPYVRTEGGTGTHEFFDGGPEKALQACMALSRTPEWRALNGEGRFLLIFRDAMRTAHVESAFIQCWTMWEHLFAIRNRHWVDPKGRVSAKEKIMYVATEILELKELGGLTQRVDELVQARNRLVHFGALPDSKSRDEAWYRSSARLFVELSEAVVVRLLQLGDPANLLNTKERLEHWVETGEHPNLERLQARSEVA